MEVFAHFDGSILGFFCGVIWQDPAFPVISEVLMAPARHSEPLLLLGNV
jgi:hypothetical protein